MKKKPSFILSFIAVLLTTISSASAQNKILSKLFSDETDSTRSPSFLPLPAIGYSQETGLEFGLLGLYSFYTDRTDIITRNSSITGLATFTTKKQSNFKLQSDIWAYQNKYHYVGEIRYKDFPFNFYGVGNHTFKADEDKLTQNLFKVSGEAEKLFSRGLYIGVNTSFENYNFKDIESGGIFSSSDAFITDRDGGKVLFLGLSQVVDSRNTNTYTTRGSYIKINYSFAPDLFGGDNFKGSLFKLDFRNFKTYNKKTVLGIQAIYQLLQGGTTPFYLLPQLGNDQIMRGYYTGRYRNKNLLAAQAELRYRLIPRIGAAAFAGAGNVYDGAIRLREFKPSAGAGLRYFFDVERGLSIRMDYGIGEKRKGEERQKGFYLSLAEAF